MKFYVLDIIHPTDYTLSVLQIDLFDRASLNLANLVEYTQYGYLLYTKSYFKLFFKETIKFSEIL